MSLRFDAVVVGAGLAGCAVSAVLSREGFRILLLEKAGSVGGKARTFDYFGFKVDNGAHIVATPDKNSILHVLNRAEADVKLLPNPIGHVTYYDWKQRKFGDFEACGLSECTAEEKAELKRVFDLLASMSVEEINERYGRMSLKEWAEQNLRYPDALSKIFLLAFQDHAKIAAPVVLRYYHNIRTSKMGMTYPKGGIQEIPNSLVRVITNCGGHVLTNAICKEIIVGDNKVKGVEFQIAPQNASYSHAVRVETDLVVSTVPAENLFGILPKERCPTNFVKHIEKIAKIPPQQTCGVIAAVKAETYKPSYFQVGVKPKEPNRKARIVFVPSVACPEIALDGYHLLYYDTTDFDPDVVINRERMYEEMLEELRSMYSGIEFQWAHLYLSSARTPVYSTDVTDSMAPDVYVEDVKGLHFAGPQFRGMGDTGPIGIGRTFSSARRCLESIILQRTPSEIVSTLR